MRYIIALLASVTLVLAACQAEEDPFSPGGSPEGTIDLFGSPSPTVDASPTGSPDAGATMGGSPSATAEASPDDTDGADASPTGSPAAGFGEDDCADAFTDVPDLNQLSSLTDFADAMDALDETIRSCDSVDDWTEQANDQLALPGMDVDAEEFLRARCEESDSLAVEDLCEDL